MTHTDTIQQTAAGRLRAAAAEFEPGSRDEAFRLAVAGWLVDAGDTDHAEAVARAYIGPDRSVA